MVRHGLLAYWLRTDRFTCCFAWSQQVALFLWVSLGHRLHVLLNGLPAAGAALRTCSWLSWRACCMACMGVAHRAC
jgi:hypothetical protein